MARKLAQEEDDELIASINVTPLVDVILVLLIIFMVTTSFIVKEAIEVDLPRAATGGEVIGTTINLVLDEEGTLFLDGEATTMEKARIVVRRVVAEGDDPRAIISADRRLSHGRVVEVIDLVRTEGLHKFAIHIEKAPPAADP